jgi:thymidylate kinase
MTAKPYTVALEGPCCAGKTTLGRLLIQELRELAVTFVPCYADHAGGGRYLPRQEADTVTEREQALRQLLPIEAGRIAQVPQQCDVLLEDRSVHTLLAHSYALQRKTGTDFLAPSERLLHSSPVPAWPGLVLYLDLPQGAVQQRNPGKFPPGSIYTDPDFNAAVRAYFRRR